MYKWQGEKYLKNELTGFLDFRLNRPIEQWEKAILIFAREWLDGSKQIFEVQTSGSTGKPKKILLTRKQMQDSAKATGSFLKLNSNDSALLVLPAEFIAGKMMIVRALELGLDLYYYPPQISVIEKINRSFDFAAFIPLQIQYAIDSGYKEKLNLIGRSIIGGTSIPEKYSQHLQNLKSEFFATYGMTETITHVAMKDLKKKDSYYTALPGIEFSVNNDQCLLIKSDRLPERITHTNDIVRLISKTEFEIKGRSDHIINSGGLKIFPEELEERIQKIIDKEVFIGYQNDEKLGQSVVLVVEDSELDEKLILDRLSVEISKNKLPKSLYALSSFYRTENHKIDRFKMQNWIANKSE